LKIFVKNNNIERALRTFKRKSKEKMLEVKERRYYTKPCQRRNEAKQAAVIRERKRQKDDRKNKF
jgi:ribosomal protein S21